MSWLRNSPLRASFGKRSTVSPPKDCDPSACYDSFRKHWQQAYEIMQSTQPPNGSPLQDDVLGVVNHLDQMVTLLLLELKGSSSNDTTRSESCLEYLLSENLLDVLFTWSIHTGKYNNVLKLEQLKLYELLISNSQQELLVHEPFLRPLLKLLGSCGECFPVEVEKRLVILLNQLCVSLMQNITLLDLFFYASSDQGPAKFVIFSLLIPFVHREGGIGQQARDALLLCMSLSKKNESVGLYIAEHSNVCPVLATGLSGLYSLLPRKLIIETEDWHRLTPDDVNDIHELTMFMNSLEFCNAVVQVAHPTVKAQLLEFLYQGFLMPVMGPALLQNTVEEIIAATAYFDLFLRSITEPGLLCKFVKFLLKDSYEGTRILESLIQRIATKSRLCLVTLALFETLVDLNCEDVMLELIFQYLIPCTHVMLSQRKRVNDIEPYFRSSEKFLSLSPSCCAAANSCLDQLNSSLSVTTSPSLPVLQPASYSGFPSRSAVASSDSLSTPSSFSPHFSRGCESLYGNYFMYLCYGRQKIQDCALACLNWKYPYDGENPPPSALEEKVGDIKVPSSEENTPKIQEELSKSSSGGVGNHAQDSGAEDGSETCARVTEHGEKTGSCDPKSECSSEANQGDNTINDQSLQSIGESSGYESFALKDSRETTPENEPNCLSDGTQNQPTIAEHRDNFNSLWQNSEFVKAKETDSAGQEQPNNGVNMKKVYRLSRNSSMVESLPRKYSRESSYMDIFNTTPNIGPFLDALLKKLENMMQNNLYINLHLTGIISRLAVYPQPLLHSFLLNHSLVFQPSIRSLFQVLASLKQKIDSYLVRQKSVEDLVLRAQSFLIGREERVANVRRYPADAPSVNNRRSSTPDAFSRHEPKRRSFTSTLQSVFSRRPRTSSVTIQESKLESTPDGTGYRYINKQTWDKNEDLLGTSVEVRNIAMGAVLLDEWLKELAAITQEHVVANEIEVVK